MAAKTMNDLAASISQEIGSDVTPRALRKFVRTFEAARDKRSDNCPGKGRRYALDARTFALYRREFVKAHGKANDNAPQESLSA